MDKKDNFLELLNFWIIDNGLDKKSFSMENLNSFFDEASIILSDLAIKNDSLRCILEEFFEENDNIVFDNCNINDISKANYKLFVELFESWCQSYFLSAKELELFDIRLFLNESCLIFERYNIFFDDLERYLIKYLNCNERDDLVDKYLLFS